MKSNKYLVILVPLGILALLEFTFFYSKFFPFAVILGNFFIIFSINKFIPKELEKLKLTFFASTIPVLFFTSLFLYSSLISVKYFVQFLFCLELIFSYYYQKQIYYYFNVPSVFDSNILKSLSIASNLLIIFFSASSAYWLQSFLNLPVWPLMSSLLLLVILIGSEMAWVNKITVQNSFVFILTIGLAILEIGWSVSFLPLNYNAAGLIIGIMYYILSSLIFIFLNGNLTRKTVELYLGFGLASLLAILLTSRWM